ncbi:MAG: tetratricopeptide repeat protein, partial [Terriglobales bacterium]
WTAKAAAQGVAPAEFNLGLQYYLGQGVPQDFARAAHWYTKAAAQGDASAEYDLGVDYDAGQGVPQDYAQAAYWFAKAAAQGNALAEYNLGALYAGGQGVPQDYVDAYKWMVLAKASSAPASAAYKDASAGMSTLAPRMTPAQISAAQAAAARWRRMREKKP